MDEKVTVNLDFFFTSLAFDSARYAPFACSYYSIACSYYSITCSYYSFPPVNKFPNKLALMYQVTYLKNPPLCSLVSFSIVLVTPFNKIPEFYNASIIFIISFISSCSMINLTPEP